jgi:ABC-2 type transport system ATP-binding protein
MIEFRELHKVYGETTALRGVTCSIAQGEIVGLLGPNGAGKTTAMRILVGCLAPTSGTALVAGRDVTSEPLSVQRMIGYLPENAPLYPDMLVQEYLDFLAGMRELPPARRRERVASVVGECDIGSVLTRPIGHLSKGFRQRTGLAGALLHDPEILVLDEATTGLDPNQIVEVRELIHQMAKTKTVILSTHILSEVEATCDRAVILIDGLVRADGRLEELTRSRALVVSAVVGDPAAAARTLSGLPGVVGVDPPEHQDGVATLRIRVAEGEEWEARVPESVAEAAGREGWRLRELRRDDRSLEQVFRSLTEGAEGVAA